MLCRRSLGDQRGQSIVQVLISVGLMGILMTAFTSMMAMQYRETNALSQKLASTDLERLLQSSLSNGSVCQYITNNPAILTFDSTKVSPTTPQIVTPTLPIFASVQLGPPVVTGPIVAQIGQSASSFSSSAIIEAIGLSISGAPSPLPTPGPGVVFTGNWIITLDPTKLVRALAPIRVATTITVDTTTPTASQITSCQSGAGISRQIVGGCNCTPTYGSGGSSCGTNPGVTTWTCWGAATGGGSSPPTCPIGTTTTVTGAVEGGATGLLCLTN